MPATPRFAYATLPCAIGILAGGVLASAPAPPVRLACAVLVVVLAAALVTSGRARLACVSLSTAFVAMAATTLVRTNAPPTDHVVHRASAGVAAVEGVVVASERAGAALRLTLRAERYRSATEHTATRGLVGVTVAHPRRDWPTGCRVRVVGRLRVPRNFANPGGYDSQRALARRGILVTMFLWDDDVVELLAQGSPSVAALLAALRAGVEARIAAVAAAPARGFLAAVLIGSQGALAPDVRHALARTGLSHVVSVSGFHLTVVAGATILCVGWLLARSQRLLLLCDTRKVATLAGVVPVVAYGEIAGGSVPATRALLMYAAVVAAMLANRPVDGMRALAAAAAALAIAVPDIAADIGFELSFVSVAALIVTARREAARSPLDRSPPSRRSALDRYLLMPLRVSTAAAVWTAPLTAWHFQQVSLIAPLANLFALPLLGPGVLLPGLAALPLLAVAPALADLALRVAAGAAVLGLRVAGGLAALPGAAVTTPMPNLFEVVLCYTAVAVPLVAAEATVSRAPRLGRLARPVARAWCALLGRPRRLLACAVVVAAVADVGYWTWERLGNPRVRVTFLSVGQGDAAVVELPRGGVMVIDGGGLAGDFDTGARLVAPFLRARKVLRVDTLVLSHPQLDHYGGLAYVAEEFAPREFWWNGVQTEAAGFARLERALERAGTRQVVLGRGSPPIVRGDVVIEVLHPAAPAIDDRNNGSLVLRLTYGGASFLFSGDIEQEAERAIAGAPGPALDGAASAHGTAADSAGGSARAPTSVVLKVPHHGSATSSSRALLSAVRPRVAVISAGADNRFGFPAPAVLERLDAVGATVWRTDQDGAVRIVSDGARLTIGAPCGRRPTQTIDLNFYHPFDSP